MNDLALQIKQSESLFGNFQELNEKKEKPTNLFQDQIGLLEQLEVMATLQIEGVKLSVEEVLNLSNSQEIATSLLHNSTANLLVNQRKFATGQLRCEGDYLTFSITTVEI
ncbi:MAG: hypothetical protein IT292_07690 [Deltaproteobacteria bacterium]|nr:hypothetical protein [Deltaproteobacteria bacterium]